MKIWASSCCHKDQSVTRVAVTITEPYCDFSPAFKPTKRTVFEKANSAWSLGETTNPPEAYEVPVLGTAVKVRKKTQQNKANLCTIYFRGVTQELITI